MTARCEAPQCVVVNATARARRRVEAAEEEPSAAAGSICLDGTPLRAAAPRPLSPHACSGASPPLRGGEHERCAAGEAAAPDEVEQSDAILNALTARAAALMSETSDRLVSLRKVLDADSTPPRARRPRLAAAPIVVAHLRRAVA